MSSDKQRCKTSIEITKILLEAALINTFSRKGVSAGRRGLGAGVGRGRAGEWAQGATPHLAQTFRIQTKATPTLAEPACSRSRPLGGCSHSANRAPPRPL